MLAGTVSTVALATIAYVFSPIDSVSWIRPREVPLEGTFASNKAFSSAELLPPPEGQGPETLILGPDGWLCTGAKSGAIYRFRDDGSQMLHFADTAGRPNGLVFDSSGNLIVAASFKELLSIPPGGVVSRLATSADGQAFASTDGLDIASDGRIWFTDASQRFPDGEFFLDAIEGGASGRLLSYDPETAEVTVDLKDLRSPNGVALGPEEGLHPDQRDPLLPHSWPVADR